MRQRLLRINGRLHCTQSSGTWFGGYFFSHRGQMYIVVAPRLTTFWVHCAREVSSGSSPGKATTAWQHGEEMDSTDIALAERARIGKSLPDLTVHALPRNPPMRVQLSTRLISSVVVVVATLLAANIAMAQWPNNPTDDPRDALPNDPSYLNVDMMGNVTGGQWNLWSFT